MDKRLVALGTLGVGFFVSASIILGVVGGRWIDGKLNTEPVFLIIGLLLGIVVAFYGVYIMLRPLMRDKQDKGE